MLFKAQLDEQVYFSEISGTKLHVVSFQQNLRFTVYEMANYTIAELSTPNSIQVVYMYSVSLVCQDEKLLKNGAARVHVI